MATITQRNIVDEIIANDGYYEDDLRVLMIVQYNNQFDGKVAYGLIYEGESLNRYHESPACHNPKTIFVASSS